MTASFSPLGLPIVDYQLATANQAQLMARFQKSSTVKADIAAYQAGVAKITTVDQFLNNYKVLKVALTAYDMEDVISQKGLLKQLLTQDPTSAASVAQRLGKQSWIAFAQAFATLKSDGGATLQNPDSINSTTARYTSAAFRQWLGVRDNDSTLTTALTAKQTLQDAVDISNVGTLFAKYQQSRDVQSALAYYQNNIGNVKAPADLLADPKLLNFALTAFGIDPNSISSDTVSKLLSQSPALKTSVAANNPTYLPFAKAFSSLFYDKGAAIHDTAAIQDVVNKYQHATFASALADNSDDQNLRMFGAAGAKQIAQIKADALAGSGAGLATSYYAAHIRNATTAARFAADAQLRGVATAAFGLGNVPAETLLKLLTQDPNNPASLAQTSPSYTAFAQAFSYYPSLTGRTSDDADKIASVQSAYEANTLETILSNDVTLAAAQKTRNTKIGENASAPLNLFQMLGDANVSTVLLGALGVPAIVASYDPDQQVEIVSHAGFKAQSLNSTTAIDSLIKRYLTNVGAQNAPTSPLLNLFGSTPQPGQIVSLDLTSILGGSSGAAALGNSSTGYLLNLL